MGTPPKVGPDTIIPERAPALGIALRFFLAGLGFLALLLVVAVWKAPMLTQDYLHNPATLAVTHLFTLGFGGSVVTGAVYQITPVLLYANLRSERRANLHFAFHAGGALIMATGFLYFQPAWVAAGGTLVVAGACLFAANLTATFRSVERWNWHGGLMAASVLYYLSTLTWGLVLAFNQRYGFLGEVEGAPLLAHLDLGMAGWFSLMIIGVGLKLVPMFAPARPLPAWHVAATGGVMAAGVPVTLAGLIWLRPLALAGALLMALSGLSYIGGVFYSFRTRRSGPLDFSVRFALTSAGMLGALLALLAGGPLAGDGLSRPALTGLTAFFALAWIGGTILGMLLRIIPFMVWLYRFRHRVFKLEKIPFLHEMFHPALAWTAYLAWYPGVALLAAGLWLRAAALIIAGAAVGLIALCALAGAVGQVVYHARPGIVALYPGRK